MIIGHQRQLNFLKKIVENGKIPHALLFVGEEKLGKKTIALEFISWLFEEPDISKIFSHPDFILVEPPTENNEGKQIKIDQIREFVSRISLKPIKSKLKAAIINEAHLMNEEAQNCFLKTLEEPKGNTLLILVTRWPNFLLSTIISRCQIIKFFPVKNEEIKRYLENQKRFSEEEIKEILEISRGRPGQAIELSCLNEKFKCYKKRIKELNKLLNSSLDVRFQYVKEIFGKENLQEILEIWLNYLRNILIKNCSTPGVEHLGNILQQIQRTIYLISTTNVNSRLALEILMTNFDSPGVTEELKNYFHNYGRKN